VHLGRCAVIGVGRGVSRCAHPELPPVPGLYRPVQTGTGSKKFARPVQAGTGPPVPAPTAAKNFLAADGIKTPVPGLYRPVQTGTGHPVPIPRQNFLPALRVNRRNLYRPVQTGTGPPVPIPRQNFLPALGVNRRDLYRPVQTGTGFWYRSAARISSQH
jgi:hypothetical protein